MISSPERYNGQPFLRLLDSYVLKAIGFLAPEDEEVLRQMTPKLQEVYEVSGTWFEIVAAVMEFPDGLASELRGMWEKNRQLALENSEELDPSVFAMMVVDDNFRSTT